MLAVWVQLAAFGMHPIGSGAAANRSAALSGGFDEHAFCLAAATAADAADQASGKAPGDTAPAERNDHDAAGCCSWHLNVAALPAPSGTIERIVFAEPTPSLPSHQPRLLGSLRPGTVGARAPPAAV
ncbi:MAG: hypothetical protein JO267_03440 [Alphaproteobacteria bacterium]|nr:hypothetical protein [Alphaproteobacteria bacterium]